MKVYGLIAKRELVWQANGRLSQAEARSSAKVGQLEGARRVCGTKRKPVWLWRQHWESISGEKTRINGMQTIVKHNRTQSWIKTWIWLFKQSVHTKKKVLWLFLLISLLRNKNTYKVKFIYKYEPLYILLPFASW